MTPGRAGGVRAMTLVVAGPSMTPAVGGRSMTPATAGRALTPVVAGRSMTPVVAGRFPARIRPRGGPAMTLAGASPAMTPARATGHRAAIPAQAAAGPVLALVVAGRPMTPARGRTSAARVMPPTPASRCPLAAPALGGAGQLPPPTRGTAVTRAMSRPRGAAAPGHRTRRVHSGAGGPAGSAGRAGTAGPRTPVPGPPGMRRRARVRPGAARPPRTRRSPRCRRCRRAAAGRWIATPPMTPAPAGTPAGTNRRMWTGDRAQREPGRGTAGRAGGGGCGVWADHPRSRHHLRERPAAGAAAGRGGHVGRQWLPVAGRQGRWRRRPHCRAGHRRPGPGPADPAGGRQTAAQRRAGPGS